MKRKNLPWRSPSIDGKWGFQSHHTAVMDSAGMRSPSTTKIQLGVFSEIFPAVISIKWPSCMGAKLTSLASLSSALIFLSTSNTCGSSESSFPIHRIMFAMIDRLCSKSLKTTDATLKLNSRSKYRWLNWNSCNLLSFWATTSDRPGLYQMLSKMKRAF